MLHPSVRPTAAALLLLTFALALSGAPGPLDAKKEPAHPATEKAIADGLRWLALHQAPDGHWGLHDFNKFARTAPLPGGKIVGDNSVPGTTRKNDVAGTAFGLLPFLAAGHTHKAPAKPVMPSYTKTVSVGLRYLLVKQTKVGASKGAFSTEMYANALATIAVCNAYALTRDPALKAPAQLAVNYVVAAQHVAGGWRYSPGMAGDTSVTSWQVAALKSGQVGGVIVPKGALQRAAKFLESAEVGQDSGGYCYVPGGAETASMTAAALSSRLHLGTAPAAKTVVNGVAKLRASPPGKTSSPYYEYYATLAILQVGGEDWKFWQLGPDGDGKGGIRDALLKSQDQGGLRPAQKGTWVGNDQIGGRLGATSLSLLMLQAPARRLPLYRPAKDKKDKQ